MTLLVQVDKENLIESLFNCYTLLIHILVFTIINKLPYTSFCLTLLLFFLKKINNLLHRVWWQAMVATQGIYLSYKRKRKEDKEILEII